MFCRVDSIDATELHQQALGSKRAAYSVCATFDHGYLRTFASFFGGAIVQQSFSSK